MYIIYPRKSKKFFLKLKKGLDKPAILLYTNKAVKKDGVYLGVAQFGSVLEWGSRGREFKSPHSDQRKTS